MDKNNIHVLARGVITDQNHILLAYDPRPNPCHYYELNGQFYYLPGVHIDFHESSQNALIREIKEETGFDSSIERFLGIVEHAWNFPGSQICCHTHEVNLIFKIQIPDLKFGGVISQKEEHVSFKWMSIDHLKDIDLRPLPLKYAISQWLGCTSNNAFWSVMK